mgnify:CR=1 FL=1
MGGEREGRPERAELRNQIDVWNPESPPMKMGGGKTLRYTCIKSYKSSGELERRSTLSHASLREVTCT